MNIQNAIQKVLDPKPTTTLTIVSGIPRSGTSLSMLILSTLGLIPFTASNRVKTHVNKMNPRGCLESVFTFKGIKADYQLNMLDGFNCLKIFTINLKQSLEFLHTVNKKIKLIFCLRDPLEIIHSRRANFKLINRLSDTSIATSILSEWTKLFYLQDLIADNDIFIMDFNELIHNPNIPIMNLASFLDLDISTQQISCVVKSCIDPFLYRSKKISINSDISKLLYKMHRLIKKKRLNPSLIPSSISSFISKASDLQII